MLEWVKKVNELKSSYSDVKSAVAEFLTNGVQALKHW